MARDRAYSPIREQRSDWFAILVLVVVLGAAGFLVWSNMRDSDESAPTASGGGEPYSTTAALETLSFGIPVPDLEDTSWRTFCNIDRPLIEVTNGRVEHPVTLDGRPTDRDEWTEAFGVFLPLEYSWGSGKHHSACPESMLAWFMNDDEWLYGLYYVPWDGSADPRNGGGFLLFRGTRCCGIASDIGTVNATETGEPWDAFGWDDLGRWVADVDADPAGRLDMEGKGTHDGHGYWFEWRKRLDSGDGRDFSVRPGQTVGDFATATWFMANFWISSESLSLERIIEMTFAE